MKKIVITVGLFLMINLSFAEGEKVNTIKEESIKTELSTFNLAPITPKEAYFETEILISIPKNLAPVTPEEAIFEDEISDEIINLAPVTPKEATFENEI